MFDPEDSAHASPALPVVLGIDPGVSRCGYGVVCRDGAAFRAVAYGVLRTPTTDDLAVRLGALSVALEALISEFRPEALAVERVLFQVNTRTAMSVGQASGLAFAAAGRAGIPAVYYSPNEVKLAVTGSGAADKAEVQHMVARLLRLEVVPDPPDAADALALALCHWWRAPMRAAGAADTPPAPRLAAAIAAAVARDGGAR